MKNNLRHFFLGAAMALSVVAQGWGYVYSAHQSVWTPGPISMQIKLGASGTLSDGTNHSTSVQAAMQTWNSYLGTVQFAPQIVAPGGQVDYVNDVYFDSTIEGQSFGSGVLAVTLTYTAPSVFEITETDIIFNTAYSWDSYRGNLQAPEDIRRVALHELGHALGLSHPDQSGQSVSALMNSTVSNLDALTADDIAGAQSIYRAPGQTAGPGNDNFANATAISLSSGSTQVTGSTLYATKESGEPNHAGETGGHSAWWKWTAPSNGSITITTQGSKFDTLLGVYTGGAVSSLTTVASNDEATPGSASYSSVTFTAAGGTTYNIAVDGWAASSGPVMLNLSFTPAGGSGLMRVTMVGLIDYIDSLGAYLPSKGARRGDPFTISATYDPAITSSPPAIVGIHPIDFSTSVTVSFSGLVYTMPGFHAEVINNLVYNSGPGGLTTVDGHILQGTVPASSDLNALDFTSILYSTNTNLVGNAASYGLQFAQSSDYNVLCFFRLQGYDKVNSYPAYLFNVSGSITSITVVPVSTTQIAPSITAHPANQAPIEGQPAQFSVTVTGVPSPVLQWQRLPAGASAWVNLSQGGNYSGVSSNTLTVSGTTASMSGDQFRCLALSSSGGAASNAALLTVAGTVPAVVNHPVDQSVTVGQVAQFAVTVAGNPLPTYQWQRQGSGTSTWTNISNDGSFSGATSATLTINTALAFQGDQFRCIATNNQGAVTSNPGRLILLTGVPGVIAAESGVYHTVFLGANGSLWGMGPNSSGELGLGAGVSSAFTQSLITTGATGISAGNATSFYIKPDGTLWGTGFAGFGQFGNGTSSGSYLSPIQVASDVVQVAASADFTMHLKRDLTLWATGRNNRGQFGTGGTGQTSSWGLVGTDVIWVATGLEHTLFIKSDGSLWAMGDNAGGQLGDGTLTERRVPVLIATNVIKAFAGSYVSYFIKADNTLWGMGSNGSGRLGDNSTIERRSPVFIASNVSFVSVPPNGDHTLFIKTDGSLWGMGNNTFGQLGTGPEVTLNQVPVLIANNVVAASTGGAFSTFAKSDGTYWGMGRSTSQQELGFPGFVNYFFPRLISVGSLVGPGTPSNVVATDAGFLNGVNITWSPTVGAAYYEMWRGTTNNSAAATRIAEGISTPLFHDSTAAPNVTYYYWIKAGNPAGTSGFSGSASVTTIGGPPVITSQPLSSSFFLASNAIFQIAAAGDPALTLTYQWQRFPSGGGVWADVGEGSGYTGTTTNTLVVSNTTLAMTGDQFRCVVTNTLGTATSNPATLTVIVPPPIIQDQPLSQTVVVGSPINLSVTATSPVALSYQWRKNGTNIPGATSSTYTIPSAQVSDSGDYLVAIYYSGGSAISSTATVVVATTPVINTQPAAQTVNAGQAASFSVTATSAAPLTYVWRKNGTPIGGATAATYTIVATQLSDAADYSVVVTNIAGSVTSNAATLTVNPLAAPVITTQPVGQSAGAGITVQFTVAASGAPAPAYQWQVQRASGGAWSNTVDGAGYSGSQTATLSVLGGQLANNGDQYRCVASNVAGSATSNAATHTVLEGPVITGHPQSQTGLLGLILQFNVTASGVPAPTYQWQRRPAGTGVWADLPDGIYVTGSTTPTLTVYFGAGWTDQDQVRCVVSNYLGSATSNAATLSWPQQAGVVRVAAGAGHTLLIRSDGVLYTTGANGFGQLGRGNTTNVNFGSWVDGPGLGNVYGHIIDVAAGANHSFYLKSDATLWAMGRNANGQLGTGDAANRLSPVQVAAGVAAAAPGTSHSLFIKQDGTLWVTGDNTYGQLGDGTNTNTLVPKQVATHVVAAASAFVHSVFLKSDGTLWSMGHNGLGELGDGSPFNRNVPVQTATGVVAFSARGYHTLFIKTDGTLWAVGYNNVGQLGDGTLDTRATPVQVATNVMAVAGGMFHSLFVKTDGTLWATGDNTYGQLGTGDTFARSSPVQVATGVIAVAAGENHSAYITTDGSYWAMGRGDSGQLGDQANQNRSTPFRIMQGYVPLPAPPTAVTASDVVHPDRIAVSWTGGLSSGYYELWRGTTNVPAAATRLSARVSTPYYEDLSATPNQPYYYWIKGVNAAGTGAFSAGDAGTAGSIAPPAIATPPQSQTVNVGANVTFSVTATGTAPFTYQWRKGTNPIGGATASSYVITGATTTDAGSYDVIVTNGAGSATSAAAVLTVNKLAQAITFNAPADRAYSLLPFALVATSDSGLPVTFLIVSGPATIDGSDLTLTGVGTVTVRAGQAGNGSYLAATNVDRSFVVSKAVATVSLGDLAATYDGTAKNATATTSPAGLNVVLTYDGGATAPTNAGSYTVAGTISEANYQGSTTDTLIIAKAAQTITFSGPASQTYSPAPIALSATADSGLPVTFSIVSGPATVSGSNLTLTGTGPVTVRASQSGDSNRLAAPNVDRSFNSNKLSQTITFAALADRAYTTVPQALAATASSGLPVSFSLVSGPATLNGSDLTITGVGTVTVRADQAGNSFYLAAADVDRSFAVSKAVATVTLGDLAATYDGTAKSVTAVTSPVGLVVDFTYDGGISAPTNAGSYAIVGTVNEANYQGSANGTLVIAKADQTITFTGPANQPYSAAPVALSATASSGLAVTFTVVSGPATVAGDALTLTGAGAVTVRATQDGDANRNAAPAIDRSFTVTANLASWQLAKFTAGELLDANISGPNADPDHDGFANLLEYALGFEPKSATTTGLPHVGIEGSDWAYTYTRPTDRTDITYVVEMSTNLSSWDSAGVSHSLVSTAGGTETWRAKYPLASAANVFFRLRVTGQ